MSSAKPASGRRKAAPASVTNEPLVGATCCRTTSLPAPSSAIRRLIVLYLFALIVVLVWLAGGEYVVDCGMSKKFLKGFIMGCMYAHHHKP